MNICNELITYNDKLYVIYRKLKQGRVKEEHFEEIKKFWNCDLVLKSKTQDVVTILFCIEVQDAVLVE